MPSLSVQNMRETEAFMTLGRLPDGTAVLNGQNFPGGNLHLPSAEWVYEVPNPFPFWGATYILKTPADRLSSAPAAFRFTKRAKTTPPEPGFLEDLLMGGVTGRRGKTYGIGSLPREIILAIAQTSRNPDLLAAIARLSCDLVDGPGGDPEGIRHETSTGERPVPVIRDHLLYETVGNNPALPNSYKKALLLAPGIQGENPILGEYSGTGTHIWEYVRANSYIPWGHFASNMAQDAVRYNARDLTLTDVQGLRHLYYQRVYVQMAGHLGLGFPYPPRKRLSPEELDALRLETGKAVKRRSEEGTGIPFTASLWGWNYGYDVSPSGYRLHASHQQIHQQFALVPPFATPVEKGEPVPSYAVGDQIADFARRYRECAGQGFFEAYIGAIRSNRRLDGRADLPANLVIHEDEHVLLHVPKAQRSQGEIQIMTRAPIGNVIEADQAVRSSLDRAILIAIRTLDALGAEMVTCYEVSKRFDDPGEDQRLFYCFLPRHPHSPGAFSEWQERWVTGHYPEDFAEAARKAAESAGQ